MRRVTKGVYKKKLTKKNKERKNRNCLARSNSMQKFCLRRLRRLAAHINFVPLHRTRPAHNTLAPLPLSAWLFGPSGKFISAFCLPVVKRPSSPHPLHFPRHSSFDAEFLLFFFWNPIRLVCLTFDLYKHSAGGGSKASDNNELE